MKIIFIGRNTNNDVVIADPYVSGQHISITQNDDGSFRISDLGSRNGTYVNGKKIVQQMLYYNDIVKIGEHIIPWQEYFQQNAGIYTGKIIKQYSIGFSDGSDKQEVAKMRIEEMKEKIDKILKNNFKLEFLNRIDEIVLFRSLTPAALEKIVDLELAKVEKRLHTKNIALRISPKVKKLLAEKGYDITYGARPLKRIIQTMILDELALEIIEGKVKEGDKVKIELEDKNKEKVAIRVN